MIEFLLQDISSAFLFRRGRCFFTLIVIVHYDIFFLLFLFVISVMELARNVVNIGTFSPSRRGLMRRLTSFFAFPLAGAFFAGAFLAAVVFAGAFFAATFLAGAFFLGAASLSSSKSLPPPFPIGISPPKSSSPSNSMESTERASSSTALALLFLDLACEEGIRGSII